MPERAFYERIDERTFVAGEATQSPWDGRLQHGSPPTALLAHAMEHQHPREAMRIARMSAEFLGPIPLAKLEVETRVVRPGRRIEMLEATLTSSGRAVVTARAWRIAVQSDGAVPPAATAPDAAPALPQTATAPSWLGTFGYGNAFEWRYVYGGDEPGPAGVWMRSHCALIAGEPMEPLARALLIADSANGISAELPMNGWLFVPPSLSIVLDRYPNGEWVLLEARTTLSRDGLGSTTLRLADEAGYIGAGSQVLLVEKRERDAPRR